MHVFERRYQRCQRDLHARRRPTLTFAAYSTPREVYDAKIIPAFKAMWKDKTGVEPQFFESYTGSTTQAQNVVNGSGADVVALSLAPDVQTIQDAGLITHDWTQAPDKGMVSSSVVVFDVRPGNPKGIKDWNDIAQPGLGLLTPDPAQSGGARWNLVSLWGSALRGDVPGINKDDQAGATKLMQDVVGNVISFDSSARTSIQNFEGGNGDVAITYENEVKTADASWLARRGRLPEGLDPDREPGGGRRHERRGALRDSSRAGVRRVPAHEGSEGLLHDTGYLRSTHAKLAQKGDPANGFPAIQDLFTVDDLGGWDKLDQDLFSDNGIATQAVANAG